MEKLTSRERILKAVNHKEPDRIPIDIGGTQQTSLHRVAQKKLLEYFDKPFNDEVFDLIQQLSRTEEFISKKFGNDCYLIMPNMSDDWELKVWSDNEASYFIDEWGIKYKKKHDGFYYDVWESPLSEGTLDALEKYKYPDPNNPGRVRGLKEKAKEAYENTDYAILMADGTWGLFLHTAVQMGFEEFYTSIITNEKLIRSIFEKNYEFEIQYWENILNEVKDYVQFVCLSDDLGNQNGPMVNPKIYREWLKPLHKKLIEHIKNIADVKVFFHSCGSIKEFIPDFIEIGVDALNPIQVSADSMDTSFLKKEYGKDIAFWGGGCDTQFVLANGSSKDVEKEVKKRIRDLAPGGGFVFAPVHNIQADVPPENISVMYETVLENGDYPID